MSTSNKAENQSTEAEQPEINAEESTLESGDELTKLRDEAGKMRDQWMRAAAEMDNVRKRAQRDIEESAKYAVTSFARDLVNVAENLQRALDSIPEEARKADEQLGNLATGVQMTLSELLAAFERQNIRRVHPVGEKFDHNLHQAVMQVEVPDTEPGTIMQVLQAGYTIHDRLLRPAMVGVAKQGETPKAVDTKV